MLPSLCRSELQWLNDLSEIANIPSRFKSKIATVNVFLFRSGSEQANCSFRIRATHTLFLLDPSHTHTISFGSEPHTHYFFRIRATHTLFLSDPSQTHTISFGSEPDTLFLSDQDPSKLKRLFKLIRV